jgi:hypothetical protein
MNNPIYLFCGGVAIDSEGRPKPLMKVNENRSLLVHYLICIKHHREHMPESVTLLCDDDQTTLIKAELRNLSYPVPIRVMACGQNTSTFHKFCHALNQSINLNGLVQFGYPDIFSFDTFTEPQEDTLNLEASVYISAAKLTSRFPRLIVDVYNNKVKGISNYSSPVPANPLYIFGGDLWGRSYQLSALVKEFRDQTAIPEPNLEYDFFFWLINHNQMHCVMLHEERLLVDSIRDVNQLMTKTGHLS